MNPRVSEGGWSLHTTTPGLLVHAVRAYGWRFIPNQVMPPLLANAGYAVLLLHRSGRSRKSNAPR